MSAVDLSSFADFLPIISFLVVFVLVYAVLNKTKIVENAWVQLILAFLMAVMFITASGARDYVENVVPWFAVLLLCLFFILALTGFAGKDVEKMNKGIGTAIVVILIIVFVLSAIFVFSEDVIPYYDWLADSPRLLGGIVLLLVSAAVSWVLIKSAGGGKK